MLGHALRGHLHASLLRADDLLLALREVVVDLGGRLWIEAGPGTRATVEVLLPADGGD